MTTRDEILDSIADKMKAVSTLKEKLDLSLLLEKHFPGCFDYGSCVTQVVGNMRCPEAARYIVKLANGHKMEAPLLSVPWALWGEGAQADYLSTDSMNQRRWDKKIIGRT